MTQMNLKQILRTSANQFGDFVKGALYEQAHTTLAIEGRRIAYNLENSMAYKSGAAAMGFLSGLAADGTLAYQAVHGNKTAQYILLAKGTVISTSLIYTGLANLGYKMQGKTGGTQ